MFEFDDQTSEAPAPHLFFISSFGFFDLVLPVLLPCFQKSKVLRFDEQIAQME